MEPKITTNPYQFRASEFAALYWGLQFRKFWFILLPVSAVLLGVLVYNTIRNPSVFSLIPFGLFVVISIRARFRFISKLKKTPGIDRLRIMKVFEYCIEIEDDAGNETPLFLVDIDEIVPSKKHYHVALKSKQIVWIPKGYFKTPGDQELFENHLIEKGKMKRG